MYLVFFVHKLHDNDIKMLCKYMEVLCQRSANKYTLKQQSYGQWNRTLAHVVYAFAPKKKCTKIKNTTETDKKKERTKNECNQKRNATKYILFIYIL